MKRSELGFNILSVGTDAVMLLLAGISAFYLREHAIELIGPVLYQLTLSDFLVQYFKTIPLIMIIFSFFGLYNVRGIRKLRREFLKISLGILAGLALVVVLFFFDQTIFPSRFIILATAGLSIFYVLFGRVLLKLVQLILFRAGRGLHQLIIINGSSTSHQIEKDLKDPSNGYRIVAEFDYSDTLIDEVNKVAEHNTIDEIFQTNSTLSDQANLKLLELCRSRGWSFSYVPNLFEMQSNVVEVNSYADVPVLSIKNTPLDGWGRVAKRILDIVASLSALLILSPVFLLIYIAIKIDSKGPVIYSALRGGCGKDFMFYKFRSMYAHLSVGLGGDEAEELRKKLWANNDRGGEDAPFLKIKHDPRVTRVGRFLRKTKLDETPQFWNVLKGDMSLVGPRAHVLDEVERYRNNYQRMFSIKPGIFGMSQLAQVTWPDLPFDEEIRLNTYYIENWTLFLDIKILVQSFWRLLFDNQKQDY